MQKKLEKSIEYLSEQIKEGVKADEALKFTQAALNLVHCSRRLAED